MVEMEHLLGSERSLSSSSATSFLRPPVVWTKTVSPGKEGLEEEVFLLHHQSNYITTEHRKPGPSKTPWP